MTFKTWRPITAALLIVGLLGISLSWNVHRAEAATVTFLTSGAGGGNQTYNVPANWNSSNNTIECIGSGGLTFNGNNGSAGGGGGAYAKITNLSLTPGGTATYNIGSSASTTDLVVKMISETYFNGSASSTASLSCAAGGLGGNQANFGKGGLAVNSTGTTKFSGGNGGTSAAFGGGGGGGASAGPTGAGNNGGNSPAATSTAIGGAGGGGSNGGSASNGASTFGAGGGIGGNGTGGTGGGARGNPPGDGTSGGGGGGSDGAANTARGGAGGCDTAFDATHGACGGGGGGGGALSGASGSGGNAGTYGGGGGGVGSSLSTQGTAGTGGQGIIVITYTPAVPIPPSATMKLQNAIFILNKSTMLLSPQ